MKGNLDDFVPTSKDMCRCLFQDESAWMGDGGLYMTFDNTWDAFRLLVEIYSTEGWLDYMYYNADKNGVEMQPMSTGTKLGRAAGRSSTSATGASPASTPSSSTSCSSSSGASSRCSCSSGSSSSSSPRSRSRPSRRAGPGPS